MVVVVVCLPNAGSTFPDGHSLSCSVSPGCMSVIGVTVRRRG